MIRSICILLLVATSALGQGYHAVWPASAHSPREVVSGKNAGYWWIDDLNKALWERESVLAGEERSWCNPVGPDPRAFDREFYRYAYTNIVMMKQWAQGLIPRFYPDLTRTSMPYTVAGVMALNGLPTNYLEWTCRRDINGTSTVHFEDPHIQSGYTSQDYAIDGLKLVIDTLQRTRPDGIDVWWDERQASSVIYECEIEEGACFSDATDFVVGDWGSVTWSEWEGNWCNWKKGLDEAYIRATHGIWWDYEVWDCDGGVRTFCLRTVDGSWTGTSYRLKGVFHTFATNTAVDTAEWYVKWGSWLDPSEAVVMSNEWENYASSVEALPRGSCEDVCSTLSVWRATAWSVQPIPDEDDFTGGMFFNAPHPNSPAISCVIDYMASFCSVGGQVEGWGEATGPTTGVRAEEQEQVVAVDWDFEYE